MNRTYVSPGVYTYETELRATYQNLGVTSAAVVGETTKGAAFQPFQISNYNEFVIKFGGQNATLLADKSGDFKYPKYEVPYIAKAYLEKANSLYVTRVLGLNGYESGNSGWVIKAGDTPLAILRSKGTYDSSGIVFRVTTLTGSGTGTEIDLTIGANTLKLSFDKSKPNYITNILGYENFGGEQDIYIEKLYSENEATGALTVDEIVNSDHKMQFQPSETPWFISTVADGNAEELFKFVTISDGNGSSREVKFSIVDINEESKTFSVLVRDFYDTDASPVVRERYTRCSLDENSRDFIGRKIGSADGTYVVKSNYFVVEFKEGVELKGKIPMGFMGFPDYVKHDIDYKTSFEPGENTRKNFLGISTVNGFNNDILKSAGQSNDLEISNGFALNGATSITIDGQPYVFSTATVSPTKPNEWKFTTMAYGGFDGWDIHNKFRTNEDAYSVSKFYSTSGLDTSLMDKVGVRARTLTNGEDGVTSDYYAYLEGVRTFANPEVTDINVLAVGGLDYGVNASLLSDIVDIVERERADSIFIMNAPNVGVNEAVDQLDSSGIVSSYTATYFPWKQFNDSENGVYINIPCTMDVLKNIAMVDKKSVPWYAVAGLDRGDVRCVKALIPLTLPQRDDLYEGKVNPIQTWSKKGVKIWGNRTLHQDTDAALSSLNVRRLILQARKLIASASLKLVFDQNDTQVRTDFINLVNPILENMRKERGLTDFRIEVDQSLESIQRKELNARILIKPTPALEYIIIEFGVTDQGVSFDDV